MKSKQESQTCKGLEWTIKCENVDMSMKFPQSKLQNEGHGWEVSDECLRTIEECPRTIGVRCIWHSYASG